MLHAKTRNIFSSHWIVRRGTEEVARIELSSFRERAEINIAGAIYTVSRESLLSGTFELQLGEQLLGRAVKNSVFRRNYEVELFERKIELRAISIWRRGLNVFEGAAMIGRIEPVGWIRRGARIDLPDELPLPVQMFLFAIALVLWRRADRAAAS